MNWLVAFCVARTLVSVSEKNVADAENGVETNGVCSNSGVDEIYSVGDDRST